MKLHLPKLLRNAVLACITAVAGIATTTMGTATFAGGVVAFAISQQQAQAALTSEVVAVNLEIDTSKSVTMGNISYANGVLTAPGKSGDITFDLDRASITQQDYLIYVTKNGDVPCWGLSVQADGTLKGLWFPNGADGANKNLAYGDAVTTTQLDSAPQNEDGTIRLSAKITSADGTSLYKGDETTDDAQRIYHNGGLKVSDVNTDVITVNTDLISKLYLPFAGKKFTFGEYSVQRAEGQYLDATTGRVQINGTASGAVDQSSAQKPIYIGGAGQLFLQTWQTGAIVLDNDIYVAASTYSDEAGSGVIRFGNDNQAGASTTLNGDIYVLENVEIKSGGANPIYLNGTITDKFNVDGSASAGGQELTIRGKGFVISGGLDVSTFIIDAGTANDAGVTFGKTVTNTGNLTLKGKLKIDDLSVYDIELPEDATFTGGDDSNGYLSSNMNYIIISNAEGATVTKGDGFALAGSAANGASFENGVLSTTGDPNTFWVTSEWNAAALADGKRYNVMDGGVLNVAQGGSLNNAAAVNIISNTKGSGTILLSSGTVELGNDSSTVFGGTLEVGTGAVLQLGGGGGGDDNGRVHAVDLSALESLDLNGGELHLRYAKADIAPVKVLAGSTLSIFDIAESKLNNKSDATRIGKLDLQADLNISTRWKSNINIGVLTGAANLNAVQTDTYENKKSHLWIDGVEDFSGQISLGGAQGHISLHLNLESGQVISASQIEKNHQNVVVAVTGTGTLHVGDTFTAVDMNSLGFDMTGWQGYTGVKGAVVTTATSTEAITRVGISDLTVKAGGTLTLKGDVWMGGTMTLASALVNEADSLAISDDILFDLTDMAYTKDGEARVYQILTTGDLSSLSGADNLAESFLTSLKADDGVVYEFGADGTLSITGLRQGMEWEQQDDNGNHGSWENGELFNSTEIFNPEEQYDVTFGALTGTTYAEPEGVQIVGAVTAKKIDIDAGAGQLYKFYTDAALDGGISAVEEDINVLSGTAWFTNGTLDLTEDTRINVQGTLALESGALTDQSKVDIVLKNAGTLRWEGNNTTDYTANGGLVIYVPGSETGNPVAVVAAANAVYATFDFGGNVVDLKHNIAGAVQGNTIELKGSAGQTIHAGREVYGSAALHLNGVNLQLDADADNAVQYGNSLSNNKYNAFAERVIVSGGANGTTILSGDNSGFAGVVAIGSGITLELASAKSLGANMALTGNGGKVAFTQGGSAQPLEYTLTTDDTYTGSTTVAKGVTLNWGEAQTDRSGDIILNNGSSLVLNCGVDNAISDGLNTGAPHKGAVTITSKSDDAGDIIPVVWNNTGKTYSGLTTISGNTVVQATRSLSTGGGKVHLSAASSVLELTDASWNGSWVSGHNVYGAGTVLLNDEGETFTNVLYGGIVAKGEENKLANLQIAAGTTLHQVGANGSNDTEKAHKRDLINQISSITVEDGATFSIADDFSYYKTVTSTWYLAGEGVEDGAGNKLGALNNRASSWVSANIVLLGDTLITSSQNLNIERNADKNNGVLTGNGHDLTFVGTAGELVWGGNIGNVGTFNVTNAGYTEFGGTVSDVTTMTVGGTKWTAFKNAITNMGTLELESNSNVAFKDNHNRSITDIIINAGAQLALNPHGINKTSNQGSYNLNSNIQLKGILNQFDGYTKLQGTLVVSDGAVLNNQWAKGLDIESLISGEGVLHLTRDNKVSNITGDSSAGFGKDNQDVRGPGGGTATLTLTNSGNTFAGTWSIDGDWEIQAAAEGALQSATVLFNHNDAKLQLQSATVNAVGIKSGTNGSTTQGSISTATAGNTIRITNTATDGMVYAGTIGDGVNVELVSGYQKLASTNQTGIHTYTATGGVLDMGGYTRAADATGADTIVATAGGTIKDLTLGAGMTLRQPLPADTTTQDTLVTSQLAGNLTLAGGDMQFYLGSSKDGAVNTQYAFDPAAAGERKLIIRDDAVTHLTFSPKASLPYIDSKGEVPYHDYQLITGLSGYEGDLSNLVHNFSDDGRSEHTFVVVDADDGTKTLVLRTTGWAEDLVWTGENSENVVDAETGEIVATKKYWDTKDTVNWEGDNQFYSDDNVTFGVVMGDADADPATPDVAIDQTVTVHEDGVNIGSMKVTGGNYVFEGGAITSVEGLGDVTISGGNVTFNNTISTKGSVSITGTAQVVLGVANSYKGNTEIAGGSIVTVKNTGALSTTTTTISNGGELDLAVAGALSVGKIDLKSGNIYATEDATINKLTLTGDSDKSLNAETGNKLTATLEGNISGNLMINTWKTQNGTVQLNMLTGQTETTASNIRVGNQDTSKGGAEAKLILNGTATQTLTAAQVKADAEGNVIEVIGGLTLKSNDFTGDGTLVLTGSGMSTGGASVGLAVSTSGEATLTSTHAAGTSFADGKKLTLTQSTGTFNTNTTTLVGKWNLKPSDIVWADGASAYLRVGQNTSNTATLTLTEGGSLKNVTVSQGSTLTASVADTALSVEKIDIIGTVHSNIDLTITGTGSKLNGNGSVGDVVLNKTGDPDLTGAQGDFFIRSYNELNQSDVDATMASLQILSGRAKLGNTCGKVTIGSIELNGTNAVMDYSGQRNIKAAVTTTLKQGKLMKASAWNGKVLIDDTVEITNQDGTTTVQDIIRSYDMGGISSAASVNIGKLTVTDTEYTKLTNVSSLKLTGKDNTITLINAMSAGDAVLGVADGGAVTLDDSAELHIDINTVLADLLGASSTADGKKESTFKLGGILSGLQNHDRVIFDTALSLFNLEATFGADGVLTLTQYAPLDGNMYVATDKQGDSTDWNKGNKDNVYDSAEGYSAIMIDKNTTIDLTREAPAAAQNGLGMVLTNLIGTSDLTITGNGDDLVTISNTVSGNEFIDFNGDITVSGTDVQILHTDAHSANAPVVNAGSTYHVDGKLTITDGELLVAAGKLELNGDDSAILGGVTVADGGQGQLILNGNTVLGGTITHAAAADMLADTEVQLPAVATAALQTIPHIVLGKTTALADGARVDAGVVMQGNTGSVLTVAEAGTATISQGATLTGMKLNLAEGTTLNLDTTGIDATTAGVIELTGATVDGKLASNGEVAVKVTQAANGTSTYGGDLGSYTGKLEMAGLGTHKLSTDAGTTDVVVTGSNIVLVPDENDTLSLRSLSVDNKSTVELNVARTDSPGNKKVATTGGVVLDGTLNLTANLCTKDEGVTIFTGGEVTLGNKAAINLAVQAVSDALADALINEGQTSVILAEDVATNSATVKITGGDKLLDKYIHNAVVKKQGNNLVLTGDIVNADNVDFHQQLAETANGTAGATLLDNAYATNTKAINAAKGDVKKVLTYLENMVTTGNTEGSDETLAAVAGASTAVLGMAAHGDLDRQLQAVRNRTTTMGVDQSVVHPEIPYFNAWINAEGDYRELSDNGSEGGYKLSNWGGTVGFDVDITPSFTAGMALTAMYGDLDGAGPDTISGDMNNYYVSAFARYCASAWTHTFVATVGTSDFSLKRSVSYGTGSYETEADTNGTSFGLMYEVGRVYALNEDYTACIQPVFNITWRHTSVDGYDEEGGDASLTVDSQTLNTVTLGAGARIQTIVGENMYNRTSILEGRLLVKADLGDRNSSVETALSAYNKDMSQKVQSAETGVIGIEAGAGLTIPLGDGGSSLFMDASVELRADYTNVNGTVGYRVNF